VVELGGQPGDLDLRLRPASGEDDSNKATFNAETSIGLVQAQVYRNELDALTPGRRYLNDITVASVEDLFKIGANHTDPRRAGASRKQSRHLALCRRPGSATPSGLPR
jgi:hypothetical protein